MKKAIISEQADRRLIEYIRSTGVEISYAERIKTVADPVSCHPDMIYCKLNENTLFKGDKNKLDPVYPGDIRYNGCSTGKYFIHNLRYTDEGLMKRVREIGLVTVDVKQGYSKCSIVVVDENSVITYDAGIAKSCMNAGMDVLLISSGHIRLPGYNTGFIGGTSGKLDREIIFNGNLEAHPDFDIIKSFIAQKGMKLKYFTEYELKDIGTIIIGDF